MESPRHYVLRDETPVTQNRNDTIIHTMSQTLKKPLFDYGALRVNGDFHDYVALNAAGQL